MYTRIYNNFSYIFNFLNTPYLTIHVQYTGFLLGLRVGHHDWSVREISCVCITVYVTG
jgi:hypothetical protein